ncbi:hypothetical protein [Nitrosospira multiformis]|nr:hypothetical protein [Nitrosospira multiformis]
MTWSFHPVTASGGLHPFTVAELTVINLEPKSPVTVMARQSDEI